MRFASFAIFVGLWQSLILAQERLLTIDDLYDPQKKINFSGSFDAGRFRWLKDGAHYLERRRTSDRQSTGWIKVHAQTGTETPFIETERLQAALEGVAGLKADDIRGLLRNLSFTLSPDEKALLIHHARDLFYYELVADRVTRLTHSPQEEEEPEFSPDSQMVSFIRDYNLYVVDLQSAREQQLTTDGNAQLLNGRLDWVYQEEIYGRGNFQAYWWSPDSSRIAYLQLSESSVPRFTVVDHIPTHLTTEITEYPKAGDPNPQVRLGVLSAAGGSTQWVDTSRYRDDILIVSVSWTPDHGLVFQVQDREQTWLDLNLWRPDRHQSRDRQGAEQPVTLLRETTPAWVDATELDDPTWLKDGSFLWLSERTGWKHFYHYSGDGKLLQAVTSGSWEVRNFHGVDEQNAWIYFSGSEHSHIANHAYRVKLDGSGLKRLSEREGTHNVDFNSGLTLFLDTWSDISTPPQVRLHDLEGRQIRVVDQNQVDELGNFKLSRPEFLQVKTRDGFVMEAMLLRPPDFDPAKKYPVMSQTYSGPHAPQVRNSWGGTTHMWHQMLSQKGYIVWICDNRTASGKGAQSAWPLYKNFGELELRDLEDGLKWLKSQSYVEGDRIGISGWSFGGYMGMPQNNPEGYKKSSVLSAAGDLHGKLLLIHGSMDDNVHLQNSVQFIYF